jgi:FdhE protein
VVPPLRCVYCDEADHRKLSFLEPSRELETTKVATCSTCLGYLKSVATIAPLSIPELLLCYLENVELDLAALERGYCRPRVVGYSFPVTLEDAS